VAIVDNAGRGVLLDRAEWDGTKRASRGLMPRFANSPNRYELKKRCLFCLTSAFESARDKYCGRTEPIVLYHFCPHETAEMILASHVLWACDLRESRNDPHELECGYELLGGVVDEMPTVILQIGQNVAQELRGLCIHVACLSSELSVASQWERYASQGSGCAIGFEITALHRVCRTKEIFHFPIIYDPGVQREAFRHFLFKSEKCPFQGLSFAGRRACHDHVLMSLATLAHRSKHQQFSTENEWRLWVNCDDKFERADREICTRKLPICTSETICEVVMGPNNSHPSDTMERLLRKQGYESTTVRRIAEDDLI
jgi:hypothetical protein